jgi:hypothetical protein
LAWIRHRLRQLDPAAVLVMPKFAYELGAEMVLGMQKELKARRKALEDLIRPIVAAEDVTADKTGARRQIAYTVFDSFALQLDLSFSAAV